MMHFFKIGEQQTSYDLFSHEGRVKRDSLSVGGVGEMEGCVGGGG